MRGTWVFNFESRFTGIDEELGGGNAEDIEADARGLNPESRILFSRGTSCKGTRT
jgi:hypothetical protein